MDMTTVAVTRGGQITLTKDVRERLSIREGDLVNLNVVGACAIVRKRDLSAFDKKNFLPENFEKVLEGLRCTSAVDKRLKRLGIVP